MQTGPSMTPRERVLTALAHRTPDRVPFSWGFGPTPEMNAVLTRFFAERGKDWEKLRAATDDKRRLEAPYVGRKLPEQTDIWGIRRKPVSYGIGIYHEFERFPLAGMQNVEELARHSWPSPDDFDYGSLRNRAAELDPDRSRVFYFFGGNPFEIYCWMTGLEESLVNLKANPDLVLAALDRITRFFEEKIRRTLAAAGDRMDILFIADDLGGQNGLLLARETYRELIQPFHRRLARLGKEMAPHLKVMFHTDGAVFDIIPDLMDAGVEILEAVQTDAQGMSPEALKSAYGGRLCFHGGISVQQLLPRSEEATVKRECRHLVEVLGQGGGYIAAPSHAIQTGTPPGNILAMLEAILGEHDLGVALKIAQTGR